MWKRANSTINGGFYSDISGFFLLMHTLGKALGLSLPSVEIGGDRGNVAGATFPPKHHRNEYNLLIQLITKKG